MNIAMLLFLIPFHAARADVAAATCVPRDLQLKSCVLKTPEVKVTLGPVKVTWLEGPWRGIAEIPDHARVSSWDSVRLVKMNGRWLLDVKFWKTSPAELTVETLEWMVAEFHQREFKVLLTKAIGKRKPAPEVKGEFIADEMLAPALLLKDGKIEWTTGKETGSF